MRLIVKWQRIFFSFIFFLQLHIRFLVPAKEDAPFIIVNERAQERPPYSSIILVTMTRVGHLHRALSLTHIAFPFTSKGDN